MKYHIITHDNIGGRSLPHAVAPCDKCIENALEEMAWNVFLYEEHKNELLTLIPEDMPCKLTNRKKPVDYMDFSKYVVSLQAIVSQKVKKLFDGLKIPQEEYSFRRVVLKGFENDPFYFLFIPRIPEKDIVWSKCDFCSTETFNLKNTVKFSSWEESRKFFPKYQIHNIALKKEYENHDILQPLMCISPFFSDRLVEAFEREKVIGYKIFRGYHFENFFKQELLFDNE